MSWTNAWKMLYVSKTGKLTSVISNLVSHCRRGRKSYKTSNHVWISSLLGVPVVIVASNLQQTLANATAAKKSKAALRRCQVKLFRMILKRDKSWTVSPNIRDLGRFAWRSGAFD